MTAPRTPATPHIYGYGSRLSSAYTAGRDGKPCALHYGTGSRAVQAWKDGRAERDKLLRAERAELIAALKGTLYVFEVRAITQSDMEQIGFARALLARLGDK